MYAPSLPPTVPDQDISILWTADPIKGKITQIFQILCKAKLILTFVGEFSGTSLNKGYQFLFDIERVKSLQNQSCRIDLTVSPGFHFLTNEVLLTRKKGFICQPFVFYLPVALTWIYFTHYRVKSQVKSNKIQGTAKDFS